MAETYIANKPLVKGNIKLRNRLAFAAIDTQTGDLNGKVTDRTLDFYREKSKGFGLVVIEHAYVAPEGKVSPHQLSICEEADIPSMRRLTDLLHENECSCQLQIDHSIEMLTDRCQDRMSRQNKQKKTPPGHCINDHLFHERHLFSPLLYRNNHRRKRSFHRSFLFLCMQRLFLQDVSKRPLAL